MVRSPEVERIVVIADALSGLREPIMFVGGAVVGLLATEPRASSLRATDDVDIVALVTDYAQHAALGERLRSRGFAEDAESRVICRWRFGEWIVDIVPPTPAILGFSNELYPSALAHRRIVEIDGVEVSHIDAPHFVGTKLLAYENRGRGGLFESHDLEDLLTVVSFRPEFLAEFTSAPEACRKAVLGRLANLRGESDFESAVEGHLAYDVPEQTQVVLARIDSILASG